MYRQRSFVLFHYYTLTGDVPFLFSFMFFERVLLFA